jgi:hypothetical protein
MGMAKAAPGHSGTVSNPARRVAGDAVPRPPPTSHT